MSKKLSDDDVIEKLDLLQDELLKVSDLLYDNNLVKKHPDLYSHFMSAFDIVYDLQQEARELKHPQSDD